MLVPPSMLLLKAAVYLFLLLGNSCVVTHQPIILGNLQIIHWSPLTPLISNLQVSTSPLLFEFGVEKLYPISEGLIGGWLNIW